MKMTQHIRRGMVILLAAVMILMGSQTMITAQAATTMKTSTAVNMRKGTNTSTAVIMTVPQGATVTIVSKDNSRWYKVTYKGKTGYIRSAYLGSEKTTQEVKTLAENLNMRSSKSLTSKSNIIKVLPKGAKVTILAKEGDNWLKVKYGGKTGYIKSGHFTDDTSRLGKMASDSTKTTTKTETKTMAEDLKMRSSMKKSDDKNVIKIIPKGAKVTILAKEKDGWYKVKYSGKTGYIMGGHFTDDKSRMGVGATKQVTKTLAYNVNFRSSTSMASKSNIIKVIPKGSKVTILRNEANNWFKISYQGKTGYIKGGYFK